MRFINYITESKPIPKVKYKDLLAYQEKSGLGACLPVAVVLRELGYGDIYFGQYGPKDDWIASFGHYWIKGKDGKIIDPTNPFLKKKDYTYWDAVKIPAKEHNPDPTAYGEDDIAFWRKILK